MCKGEQKDAKCFCNLYLHEFAPTSSLKQLLTGPKMNVMYKKNAKVNPIAKYRVL